jgi:hypothetical protein
MPIANAPPFFAAQIKVLNSLGNQHAGLTRRLRTAAGRPTGNLMSKSPMEGRSE